MPLPTMQLNKSVHINQGNNRKKLPRSFRSQPNFKIIIVKAYVIVQPKVVFGFFSKRKKNRLNEKY